MDAKSINSRGSKFQLACGPKSQLLQRLWQVIKSVNNESSKIENALNIMFLTLKVCSLGLDFYLFF